MINEAYCSYEVSKLLKEKGFDAPCQCIYIDDSGNIEWANLVYERFRYSPTISKKVLRPTLQMAMAFLREVHGLFIWIGYKAGSGLNWYYEVHNMKDGEVKHIGGIQAGSYETICEEALLYTLKNLI